MVKLKMFKTVSLVLVIGLFTVYILSSSAAIAKQKTIIAEAILSEAELPLPVRKIWDNTIAECTAFEGDLIETFGGTELAFGQLHDYKTSVRFYLLPCGAPGAYNVPYIGIFYYPEEKLAQIVSFPTLEVSGPTTVDVILNAYWDAENQQLYSFYKGRGIGDCGTSSIWKWNETSTDSAFVLIEQRAKDNCDGVNDEWPLVWPIR